MKRLCTGFRGRNGVLHRKILYTLPMYFRQLQRSLPPAPIRTVRSVLEAAKALDIMLLQKPAEQ